MKRCDSEDNKIDFGEGGIVDDKMFKISYYGQLRFCGLCPSKHRWECPVRTGYDFMRTSCKRKTGKVKIYSDSNLTHTHQLMLKQDVACMSGAGIGQLLNIILLETLH